MSGIYTITNLIDGKMYVGFAIVFNTRKNDHWDKLRKNKHKNIHLQRAWNKYGEENFVFEILEECENKFLTSQEHYWATILNTHNREYGYNLRPTNPFGKTIVPKEMRDKMSKLYKGRKLPKSTHEKLWESRRKSGWTMSQEQKNKIGNANKGKTHIPKNKKIILQFDMNNILIKEWDSLSEAIRENKGDIWACLNGKQKATNKQFKWKYKYEKEKNDKNPEEGS